MTPTSSDDYIVLHSRDRLADNGTPAFTERFLSHLDRLSHPGAPRPHAARSGTPAVPLTLAEGLARLAMEYPMLATAVQHCCIQGQTQRAAALTLGIDPTTARRRRRQGIAQLVVWCGLCEQQVKDALGDVDKPLALLPHAG